MIDYQGRIYTQIEACQIEDVAMINKSFIFFAVVILAVSAEAAPTVNRSFDPTQYTPEVPVDVSIQIVPDAGTNVYAAEDAPPAGWTVSNINNSGTWDDTNKKVKWGPFFDNTNRTFSYDVVPPTGESGTKQFYGIYSADGGAVTINIDIQIEPDVYVSISGYVRTSGGTGISGVMMGGLPGSPTTSASGYFSASISSGWSGTVAPSKAGYIFSPLTRPYSNVTTDQTNQDYSGTPTYTISGYVRTAGGTGISGVSMGGLPGIPSTNASGFYTATVFSGISYNVTPSRAGYTFSPPSTAYPSVSSDHPNQDYTGTLNTYTISGNAGIAGAVMNGLPGSPTTNGIGFYTATVDHGWSGTVTPSKAGYTFAPVSQTYPSVTGNQTSQNYTGTIDTFTISGHVRTAGGTGIDSVMISTTGLPNTTTNSSGYYSVTVEYDWSGTVTPSLGGYSFTPALRNYSNVTSDQTGENYTGTLTTYTISGYVRTSGAVGISGVTMNGLPGTPVTDGDGFYSDTVDSGWSGTVTPSKADYIIDPTSRIYNNVTSDQTNQNYTGIPTSATFEISGYVRTAGGSGINGVTMGGLPGNPTTGASGFYTATVSAGFSGTVTPNLAGYSFSPTSIPYSNVLSDQSNQNYTGTPPVANPVISGYVRTAGGTGISGVTMGGLPGSPVTNASGFYTATVNSGWSGTVTPSLVGYTFSPTSIPYSNVNTNQSNQNYTGTPQAVNLVISGYVRTEGGTGISGVTMGDLSGSPTTDGNGFYTATVTNGWTGTVTPNLAGYTFSPPSNTYNNVIADHANQNYVGTQIPIRIYGYTATYEPNSIIHLNNLETGEQIPVGMSDVSSLRALEVSPTDGNFYGLSYDDGYLNIHHIDVFTGEGILLQEGTIHSADSFVSMAFDPNGNLYTITTKSTELYSSIYQIDISTGDSNWVGSLQPFQNITTFAIDDTGRAIIWDKDTKWLIEVNLTDLSLYPLGYLNGNFDAFDYAANGVLYGWSDTELYTIDVDAPEANLVHTFDLESKGFACILQPKIKVLHPSGGEVYLDGTELTIQWISQVPIWDIMIEYSLESGSTWAEVVPPNVGNNGSYNWIVPEATSEDCYVRVSDTANPDVFDMNDNPFAIYECQGILVGDLNNDCYVDMKDFVLFCQNWLQCRNPYDESCEP